MKVELCAASIEAIKVASEFNFDRIELCQNLEQGGTTPSTGMIEYALKLGIETHVLIRPRPGGFQYSRDEINIMIRDIRTSKRLGAQGVVIGALDHTGGINVQAMERMMLEAEGMTVTFHRAFDDLTNFKKGLDVLIQLNVHRVLTSGLAPNVDLGLEDLKAMMEYASGKIEIMTGGGVNASNIARLQSEVNPDAIHFSGTIKQTMDEHSLFTESVLQVDTEKVASILREIKRT